MPVAHVDLIGPASIDRGIPWKMLIKIPGDVRQANFRGQIRRIPAGEILADLRFDTPTYDPNEDVTDLLVLLGGSQTEALPITTASYWSYDVRMSPLLQDARILVGGLVEVNEVVTKS